MVYRLDVPSAAATPPSAGTAGTEGFPTAGSPPSVPPAVIDPYFHYALGEEVRNAAVASGLTPTKTSLAQLTESIKRFAGGNVTSVSTTETLNADNAGVVLVNAAGGNITITLPAAAAATPPGGVSSTLPATTTGVPLPFFFLRTDSSTNVVNIVTTGTDTYLPGGGSTVVLAPTSVVHMLGDGVAGYITINTITGSNQMFSAVVTKTANYTLTSANNANLILVNGTYTQTLPATAGIAAGYSAMIYNVAGVTTINPNGATVQLASGATSANFTLPSGTDFIWLEWEGTYWRVIGGSAFVLGALKNSNNLSDLASLATALGNLSFASDGASYFKIPDPSNPTKPWIVQFAQFTTNSSGYTTWTFPIAFPNAVKWAGGTLIANNAVNYSVDINFASVSLSGVPVANITAATTGIYTSATNLMIAIGK